MKFFWLLMFAMSGWLCGCAPQQNNVLGGPINMHPASGLGAPNKLWGEQSALYYHDEVTTQGAKSRTLMAYGTSKTPDVAIAGIITGAVAGHAVAGPPGAGAVALIGGITGHYIDSTTSQPSLINQASKILGPALPTP